MSHMVQLYDDQTYHPGEQQNQWKNKYNCETSKGNCNKTQKPNDLIKYGGGYDDIRKLLTETNN